MFTIAKVGKSLLLKMVNFDRVRQGKADSYDSWFVKQIKLPQIPTSFNSVACLSPASALRFAEFVFLQRA